MLTILIQIEQRHHLRHGCPQRCLGQEERDTSIFQHKAQALQWQAGVKGKISAARLEYTQDAHDQRDRAFGANTDQPIRADSAGKKLVGKLVRTGIQLVVAQLLLFKHQRHGVGAALDLGLKQLVNAQVIRVGGGSVIPCQQQLPLGGGQQRQPVNPLIGLGHNAAQQLGEVARHTLDRGGGEEVGVVIEHEAQCLTLIVNQQGEVKLPRPRPAGLLYAVGCDSHVVRRRRVIALALREQEERLNQRRYARIAPGQEFLHEQREGVMLMRQGTAYRLRNLGQEGAERGGRGRIEG